MKVAIVGAGITGLYLSWKLAEKGEDVTVFEMKKAIGKLACSGLFSDRVLDFIPESQNLIQNQIVAAKIHFPKRTVEVRFSKKFYVMSHFELDNLVANLAKRAGAKIIPNHNVLISDIDGFSKEFDKIIGCDGPNSVVRKSLGLPDPNYRLAIQGFILGQDYSNFVETWPIENGFIWKIPRGKETEYGIIGNPKKIKEIFDEFLDKNKIHLERVSSAIIPQGLIVSDNPKMTLCGDACGLTKPWSGGGVVWGLVAAKILLENFPDFLRYKNKLKRFFLPKIIFSKLAIKIAYFLGLKMPWLLPKEIKIESDFLL